MRALLLHNPNAGTAEDEQALVKAFDGIGWKVHECVPKDEVDSCLRHKSDVIVVAGGDGTIAKVAKKLAGTDVPMAIVPTGTANNVARSLGIGVDAKTAVTGLACAKERRMDLGRVKSAHGKAKFLEGFGLGVFAYVLGEKASKKHKKLRKALGLVADELENYHPPQFEIEADGKDYSGRYLFVCVMNMRSFGPALALAPHAQWDDGLFDVVLVRPESREALVRHLRRSVEEGDIALPAFETVRAKHVVVKADGRWSHNDDRPRELHGAATLDVEPAAVRVLIPAP